MSKFDEWWSGDLNPVRKMPETTQYQIKDFMRQAFNAGRAVDHRALARIDMSK